MKKHVTLFSSVLMMSTTLLGAGQAFAAVSEPSTPDPAEARTEVTANLTINPTPDKPEPPVDPGEGGTDEETNISGLFGIAYAPGGLSGNGQLKDQGVSTIDLTNNAGDNVQNKHNVGVQDKTRAKDRNWSLTAQLEWTNDDQGYLDGATITATEGNVKINEGGDLTGPVTGEEVIMESSAENLTISKNAPTTIMKAQKGKTVNGVYNYQFKAPKLVIQNSQNVAEGTYNGNIVWNLSNVLG
ncbi:WxL domain-containing protein [Enterococcus faecium]|uniref:WxL domain-containing protein n=1 Tax=Enterococcus faecium TaxID=1352 RepID=UPI0025B24A84|nr:WxL domain-containing protein [Enterococcus faecium]MDN3079587.1 WxL domain-containing protein [Enterococcus faecium]